MRIMNVNWILVPIDFSNDSRRALEVADAQAGRSAAGLILLHVRRPVEQVHAQFTFASVALERWGKFLRHVSPENVAYLTVVGDPLNEILKIAEQYQPR